MSTSGVDVFFEFDKGRIGPTESVIFSRTVSAVFLPKFSFHARAGMLLMIAVLAFHVPARAEALLLSFASAQIGPFSNPICLQRDQDFVGGGPSQAQCLGNLSGGTTYDVVGFGSAAFGRLGVLDSVDLHNVTPLEFPGEAVSGYAEFLDSLTFSAGSTALFTFTVTGSGNGTAAFGRANSSLQGVDPLQPTILTFSYTITPGVPVAIGFQLTTGDPGHLSFPGCGLPGPPCDFRVVSDFSDTAALGPVQVLDSLGNLLTGVTITSESGFDYSRGAPPESTVPEPGTLLVTAAGCMLLLFLPSTRGKTIDRATTLSDRFCARHESGWSGDFRTLLRQPLPLDPPGI